MAVSTIVRTSKNTAMLLTGTMTRMVASFAFVLYCAAILGVERFGKYSIAIHYFELFLSLTATAVGILLTRDIARWPRHLNQLLTSAIVLVLILCAGAPAVMVLFGQLFNYSDDTIQAIIIASLALVPASICLVLEAVFIARERAEFVTAGTAIESLSRIVLSFVVLMQGYGILALLWVLLVVRCVLLAVYIVGLRRLTKPQWRFSRRRCLRFFRRWRVFAAENWMATIYTNLDVLVLSWISGEVAVGLYSAAWKVVRLGTVVAKSYTTAVFPVMSRMYVQSRSAFNRLYRHTIRIMCTLALPAIAGVSVLPDRIVDLLFSDEYTPAAPVLQVLIWVLLIEFLNPFLSHALFAQGKQHRSMHVAAISLVVNSVATYLLVVRYGAVGAALGTVLGGMVATCCYLMFAMPRKEIIATILVGIRALVAAAGLGVAIYLGREQPWLLLGLISVAVYMPLLFLVGAVRIQDLRFLQTTFLSRVAS